MLKIEVIRKVNIEPIAEEWLHEVVRKELQKQLPADVVINKIDFVRKLNPQRIEIEVDAQFADSIKTSSEAPKATQQLEVADTPSEPEEAPVEAPKQDLKNIFG